MEMSIVKITTYNGVQDDVLQCTGIGACGFYCQPFGDIESVVVSVWARTETVQADYNFIIFGESFTKTVPTTWTRLIFKINKKNNTPIYSDADVHIKIENFNANGHIYLYKMMVEADTRVYSDWKMAPEDELMYERRKSGTVIQFNDALVNSNLQDLILYGTAGKVIQDAVYVYIKYSDNIVKKYYLPLVLIENPDAEVIDEDDIYSIKLFELDGEYDEFSFKEGVYTRKIGIIEENNIETLILLNPIEIEYLNKDGEETPLRMDQLRIYIQNWSNIILTEERGEICCSLTDYDEKASNFSFSSIDKLYITAAWLRKDVSSVEAYSKGLKARNEEQINKNKLDKVIEIDREEGTIQIGSDVGEHLVIDNNSVTISKGEEMNSQFTSDAVTIGSFSLQIIENGLAFIYLK